MKRKLILTNINRHVATTVMEDGVPMELHLSKREREAKHALGNIYIGKVKHIVPNIGAAFIEIEPGVECYYSIAQNEHPIFTNKIGKKPLCIGDELLVQITKEAVKTKAQTVSSNLSFPGKYVVLTTGESKIGVSSKISGERRAELTDWMRDFVADAYGFVVRTNAKDVDKETLRHETQRLLSEYESLRRIADTRACFQILKKAPSAYVTELRNIYEDGLDEIVVEDPEIYEEVKTFLEKEQPKDLEKLVLYKDPLLPLHKLYQIERTIDEALRTRVWLKSGAYLVIEPTEALTVIDVNTGKCVTKKAAEETYYKINVEAAKETARQIRLRNLSGIILVDFINLKSKEQTEELLCLLRGFLKKDPVQTTLVDMTKLHLVEITRKKIRRPLQECAVDFQKSRSEENGNKKYSL